MKCSRLASLCALGGLSILLLGCRELPELGARSVSAAPRDTRETRLGRAIAPLVEAHPDRSGVFALADGRDAFAARALLANAAERSIDAQYYIWRQDMSGTLLFQALRRAADRGVRVRLLLDDNNTPGLDTMLAALHAHPNIEVRLFNPFMHRRWRALGYLTDFRRLNRRMHNKSFTVDNQATIIGGRNVGDEYFGAEQDFAFIDLDVIAIGPVVREVSDDFDRYWASDSSYPADRILPSIDGRALGFLESQHAGLRKNSAVIDYMQTLARLPFVQQLLEARLPLEWANTRMVSDDPAKALGRAQDASLLTQRLLQAVGAPTRELQLISPYFVPTAAGADALVNQANQGVKISILTNSLEATDVTAVHAGYAKQRRTLLEHGIVLFEMQRNSSLPFVADRGLPGSSASSLHAKTFAVDRARVFVGSFNFDPRSARLNTENGFVIESPSMAQRLADAFANTIPLRAYELRLGKNGSLQWVEQRGGKALVHDEEPGVGIWRRCAVAVYSVLPIEWLL